MLTSAVVFALTTSGARSGGVGPIAFTTITAEQLAAGGITLNVPQGSIPSLANGEAAASAASHAFGGNKILEYHYAYCVDTQHVPALGLDCWAVSLDPSGFGGGGTPHTGPATAASYLLVLIDPANDTLIEGQSD